MHKNALLLSFFFSLFFSKAFAADVCLGGSSDDKVFDIQKTPDKGSLIILFTTSVDNDFSDNHGGWDVGLIKLDSAGGVEWKKSIGTARNDTFISCTIAFGQIFIQTHDRINVDSAEEVFFVLGLNGNTVRATNISSVNHNAQNLGALLSPFLVNHSEEIYTFIYADTSLQFVKIKNDGNIDWKVNFDKRELFRTIQCNHGWVSATYVVGYSSLINEDHPVINVQFISPCTIADSTRSYNANKFFILNDSGTVIAEKSRPVPEDIFWGRYVPVAYDFLDTFSNKLFFDSGSPIGMQFVESFDLNSYTMDSDYYYGKILYNDSTENNLWMTDYKYLDSLSADTITLLLKKGSYDGSVRWEVPLFSKAGWSGVYPLYSDIVNDQKDFLMIYFWDYEDIHRRDSAFIILIDSSGRIKYKQPFLPDNIPYNSFGRGINYYKFTLGYNKVFYSNKIEDTLYTYFAFTSERINEEQFVLKTIISTGHTEFLYDVFNADSLMDSLCYLLYMDENIVLYNDHHEDCDLGGWDVHLSNNPVRATSIGINKDLQQHIQLFPNPTNGYCNFFLDEEINQVLLSISDFFGRKVYSSVLKQNQSTMDLSFLPNGIYFLSFEDGKDYYTKKLIIQK